MTVRAPVVLKDGLLAELPSGDSLPAASLAKSVLGTCATAQATVAKVADLANYVLTQGDVIEVLFASAAVASATLNVNGTGAKAIYAYGAVTGTSTWAAGQIVGLLYDGTYWHVQWVKTPGTGAFVAYLTTASIGSGTFAVARGGTGKASWTAFGVPYASATTTLAEVAPNTTATRKFFRMLGTGSAGAAPAWDVLTAADVPDLSSVYLTPTAAAALYLTTTAAATTYQPVGSYVLASDSRLADARTPTTHASSHLPAGADAIQSATATQPGLMTAAQAAKLDGIAAGATAYALPTATAEVLGGVKVGSGLAIADGVLSATAQSAGINYIANGDAEVNAAGWALYADAAGVLPVDGTGGTPAAGFTFERDASVPIRGVGSFYFNKSGNCQGSGASYDFTLDDADIGHVLTVSLDMMPGSGTYIANGVSLWVYAVGSGVMCTVSGENVIAESMSRSLSFQFAAREDTSNYRLIIHVATDDAGDFGLRFDNIRVSPTTVLNAPAMTDWIDAGACVIEAVTTNPTKATTREVDRVSYKRVGDEAIVRWEYRAASATGAAVGSGVYLFKMPAGLVIDTTKVSSDGTIVAGSVVGIVKTHNATARTTGNAIVYDSTRVWAYVSNATEDLPISSTNGMLTTAGLAYSIEIRVPIVGWGGTTAVQPGSRYRWAERYAANATRVTTTPTALGQYRCTRLGTDTAPTTAPTPGDGLRLDSGSGIAAGRVNRYEIYVGPNKCVHLESYLSTGRSGYFCPDFYLYFDGSASHLRGVIFSYNAVTGVVSLFVGVASALATVGTAGDGASVPSTGYFDLLIADDPVPVALAPAVHVEATSNAGQALTADVTSVQYEDVITDTHGAWSGNLFTVPAGCGGVYLISASAQFTAAAARRMYLRVNSVNGANVGYEVSAHTVLFATGVAVALAAGDAVNFKVSEDGTRNTTSLNNYLSITRIGDA